MKNMKRLLTLCVVAMLIATTLILTSCSGGVEGAIEKLQNADSFTVTQKSDEGSEITMVDVKNLIAYGKELDKDGNVEEETYLWYDEDADKYYSASKEGSTITKEELKKDEFLQSFVNYANEAYGLAGFLKVIDKIEEADGVYTMKVDRSENSSTTSTIKVDDDGNIVATSSYSFTVSGTTTTTSYTSTYSAINDTEIVIPDDVKAAAVKAAE